MSALACALLLGLPGLVGAADPPTLPVSLPVGDPGVDYNHYTVGTMRIEYPATIYANAYVVYPQSDGQGVKLQAGWSFYEVSNDQDKWYFWLVSNVYGNQITTCQSPCPINDNWGGTDSSSGTITNTHNGGAVGYASWRVQDRWERRSWITGGLLEYQCRTDVADNTGYHQGPQTC